MCVLFLLKDLYSWWESLPLIAQRYSTASRQIMLFTALLHEKPPNRIWLSCVMTENKNTVWGKESITFPWQWNHSTYIFISVKDWCYMLLLLHNVNNNSRKDESIILQATRQGDKISFFTPRCVLLWEKARRSWFLHSQCFVAETINAQQHCWSDHTWHKSL